MGRLGQNLRKKYLEPDGTDPYADMKDEELELNWLSKNPKSERGAKDASPSVLLQIQRDTQGKAADASAEKERTSVVGQGAAPQGENFLKRGLRAAGESLVAIGDAGGRLLTGRTEQQQTQDTANQSSLPAIEADMDRKRLGMALSTAGFRGTPAGVDPSNMGVMANAPAEVLQGIMKGNPELAATAQADLAQQKAARDAQSEKQRLQVANVVKSVEDRNANLPPEQKAEIVEKATREQERAVFQDEGLVQAMAEARRQGAIEFQRSGDMNAAMKRVQEHGALLTNNLRQAKKTAELSGQATDAAADYEGFLTRWTDPKEFSRMMLTSGVPMAIAYATGVGGLSTAARLAIQMYGSTLSSAAIQKLYDGGPIDWNAAGVEGVTNAGEIPATDALRSLLGGAGKAAVQGAVKKGLGGRIVDAARPLAAAAIVEPTEEVPQEALSTLISENRLMRPGEIKSVVADSAMMGPLLGSGLGAVDRRREARLAANANKPAASQGADDKALTGMRVQTIGPRPTEGEAPKNNLIQRAADTAAKVAARTAGWSLGSATGHPFAVGGPIADKLEGPFRSIAGSVTGASKSRTAPVGHYLPGGDIVDGEIDYGLDPTGMQAFEATPDTGAMAALAETQNVDPKSIPGLNVNDPVRALAARAGVDPFYGREAREEEQRAMDAPLDAMIAQQEAQRVAAEEAQMAETLAGEQAAQDAFEQEQAAKNDPVLIAQKQQQDAKMELQRVSVANRLRAEKLKDSELAVREAEAKRVADLRAEDPALPDLVASMVPPKGPLTYANALKQSRKALGLPDPDAAAPTGPTTPGALSPEEAAAAVAANDPFQTAENVPAGEVGARLPGWEGDPNRGGFAGFSPEEQAQLQGMIGPDGRLPSPPADAPVEGMPQEQALAELDKILDQTGNNLGATNAKLTEWLTPDQIKGVQQVIKDRIAERKKLATPSTVMEDKLAGTEGDLGALDPIEAAKRVAAAKNAPTTNAAADARVAGATALDDLNRLLSGPPAPIVGEPPRKTEGTAEDQLRRRRQLNQEAADRAAARQAEADRAAAAGDRIPTKDELKETQAYRDTMESHKAGTLLDAQRRVISPESASTARSIGYKLGRAEWDAKNKKKGPDDGPTSAPLAGLLESLSEKDLGAIVADKANDQAMRDAALDLLTKRAAENSAKNPVTVPENQAEIDAANVTALADEKPPKKTTRRPVQKATEKAPEAPPAAPAKAEASGPTKAPAKAPSGSQTIRGLLEAGDKEGASKLAKDRSDSPAGAKGRTRGKEYEVGDFLLDSDGKPSNTLVVGVDKDGGLEVVRPKGSAPSETPKGRAYSAEATPQSKADELGFYSQAERALSDAKTPAKQRGSAWDAFFRNPQRGITKEEFHWTGLGDFLKKNADSTLTLEQVAGYLKQNKVEIIEIGNPNTRKVSLIAEEIGNGMTSVRQDASNGAETEILVKESGQGYVFKHPKSGDTYRFDNREDAIDSAKLALESRLKESKTRTKHGAYTAKGAQSNYREIKLTVPRTREGENTFTQPAHYEERGIVVSFRVNDRKMTGGKTLFVEEIQSDAGSRAKEGFAPTKAQQDRVDIAKSELSGFVEDMRAKYGLAEGIKKENWSESERAKHQSLVGEWRTAIQVVVPGNGPPPAPFIAETKKYTDLAVKRLLRIAAEEGYDSVAWTTGDMQSRRWSLVQHADRISYDAQNGMLNAYKNGELSTSKEVAPDKLGDYVGKELAEELLGQPDANWKVTRNEGTNHLKVVNDAGIEAFPRRFYHSEAEAKTHAETLNKTKTVSGDDLAVGSKWAYDYYDKVIPGSFERVGKKFGVKVGESEFEFLKGSSISEGSQGWFVNRPDGHKATNEDLGIGERWEINEPVYFDRKADAVAAVKKVDAAWAADQNQAVGPTKLQSVSLTPEIRERIANEGFAQYSIEGDFQNQGVKGPKSADRALLRMTTAGQEKSPSGVEREEFPGVRKIKPGRPYDVPGIVEGTPRDPRTQTPFREGELSVEDWKRDQPISKGEKYSAEGLDYERIPADWNPPTAGEVRKNLPAGLAENLVKVGDGVYEAETPRGTVRINMVPSFSVDLEALEAGRTGAKAAYLRGDLRVPGEKTTIGGKAVINAVEAGVLPHEVEHVWFDHFADPKQREFLIKKFQGLAKGLKQDVRETIGDAYSAYHKRMMADPGWKPTTPVGKFIKNIYDFFKGAYRSYRPSVESTFEGIRTGKEFAKAPVKGSDTGMVARGGWGPGKVGSKRVGDAYMAKKRVNNDTRPFETHVTEPTLIAGGSAWAFPAIPASKAGDPSFTLKASHKEGPPRILFPDGTVKELPMRGSARLMGLPDSFNLPADKALARTILGNGIPPDMMRDLVSPMLEGRVKGKASAITTFSGAEVGFQKLGDKLDIKTGVEYNPKIAEWSRNNNDHPIETADIRDFDFTPYAGSDYFHASPVCKNYSDAKAQQGEIALDMETAQAVARGLEVIKPKIFTVENVPKYMNSEAVQVIEAKLKELGYKWDKRSYNAADFGVPQSRNRMLLRAVREGELPAPPKAKAHVGWYDAVKDLDLSKGSSLAAWQKDRLTAKGHITVTNPQFVAAQVASGKSVDVAEYDSDPNVAERRLRTTAEQSVPLPKPQYSVATLPESIAAYETQAKELGFSKKVIKAGVSAAKRAAAIFSSHPNLLPIDTKGSPIRESNPDFGITLDFDQVCPRAEGFNAAVDAVQSLTNKILNRKQRLSMGLLMRDKGMVPQCTYCYTGSKRANRGTFAQKAAEEGFTLRRGKPDEQHYGPMDPKMFIDPEFREAKFKKNPALREHYKAFQSYIGGAGATANMPFSPWRSGILNKALANMAKKAGVDQKVLTDKYRSTWGLRVDSNTDFKPWNALDFMQAVFELQTEGMPAHTYTKEMDFALSFLHSGIKFNLSLLGEGRADYSISFDAREGIDPAFAKWAHKNSDHLGGMLLATNENGILAAMRPEYDDTIGQIIPFHFSGMTKAEAAELGWTDFDSKTQAHEVPLSPSELAPGQTSGDYSTKILSDKHKNDLDTYLRLVEDAGMRPRFKGFIYALDGDVVRGKIRRGPDGLPVRRWTGIEGLKNTSALMKAAGVKGFDDPKAVQAYGRKMELGYMKLIKDYARTDTPFNPPTPDFNMDHIEKMLDDWQKEGKTAGETEADQGLVDDFLRMQREGTLPQLRPRTEAEKAPLSAPQRVKDSMKKSAKPLKAGEKRIELKQFIRRGNVEIVTAGGPKKMLAYDSGVKGLAITRNPQGGGFTLTHEATGMSFGVTAAPRYEGELLKLAKDIHGVFGDSLIEKDFHKNSTADQKVKMGDLLWEFRRNTKGAPKRRPIDPQAVKLRSEYDARVKKLKTLSEQEKQSFEPKTGDESRALARRDPVGYVLESATNYILDNMMRSAYETEIGRQFGGRIPINEEVRGAYVQGPHEGAWAGLRSPKWGGGEGAIKVSRSGTLLRTADRMTKTPEARANLLRLAAAGNAEAIDLLYEQYKHQLKQTIAHESLHGFADTIDENRLMQEKMDASADSMLAHKMPNGRTLDEELDQYFGAKSMEQHFKDDIKARASEASERLDRKGFRSWELPAKAFYQEAVGAPKFTEEELVKNAGRTAITRGASTHARALTSIVKGKSVIEWGQGKGDDVKYYKGKATNVQGYDPAHQPVKPKGKAEVVTNTFIGNVLGPKMRHDMWKEAFDHATEKMHVAVRSESGMVGEPIYDGILMGPAPIDGSLGVRTFQRFYKKGELVAELRKLFPDHTVEPGPRTVVNEDGSPVLNKKGKPLKLGNHVTTAVVIRKGTGTAPKMAVDVAKQVARVLTPDLLTPKWRAMVEKGDHPTTGHCYAASEAAFHLLGGKDAGYQARVANLGKDANGETITHWWLEGPDGRIDPTSAQFTPDKLKEAYSVGKPIGFLTKDPSKRAKTIMDRVGVSSGKSS